MKLRKSVQVGDVITGTPFVHGRKREKRQSNEPVFVGYAAPYVQSDDKDTIVDASDPTRAQSYFLVLDIEADGEVHAIRLDGNMDYPREYDTERIQFTFDNAVAPDRAIEAVERVAVTLNAKTIAVGDLIRSGRFGEAKILKNEVETPPSVTDRFLVTGLSMEGGGQSGHRSTDVYPDGRYVKAVQISADGRYDHKSARVEFYMSGSFIWEVMLQSVVVIGRCLATTVVVETLDLDS